MADHHVTRIPLSRLARDVASALIAGLWPDRDFHEVEARLAALAPRAQAVIVGTTLGLLFLCALFAAQFGVPGLFLYFLVAAAIVA